MFPGNISSKNSYKHIYSFLKLKSRIFKISPGNYINNKCIKQYSKNHKIGNLKKRNLQTNNPLPLCKGLPSC